MLMTRGLQEFQYITDSNGVKYKVILKPASKKLKGRGLRRKARRKVFLYMFFFLILTSAPISWFILRQNTSPVAGFKQKVGFPIYYPTTLPDGYVLKQDSIKVTDSIIFFSIAHDDEYISFSQQSISGKPPDLKAATGFHPTPVPAGTAYAGDNEFGKPTAILATRTTLINISGSDDVTDLLVGQILQSMKLVD